MPEKRLTDPLPPRSVIGILGAGQLGKMLAQAASRLGLRTHVYADDAGPALDVAGAHSIGSYTSLPRLDEFARGVDVVTYEFENVPVIAAEHLAGRVPVRPGARALAVAQDRIAEKTFIRDLGIAVAPFAAISHSGDLEAAAACLASWGSPGILKTSRLGYDGKGQVGIASASELAGAFAALGGVPCVLEQRLTFVAEVSVLVVRSVDGQLSTYDIPRNEHAGGILRRSTVPSGLPPAADAMARRMASRVAEALGYVGVLGVEMFYLGESAVEPLVINEIAPRVHNSGHWTMDACVVGQFENHVRAVAGWPLGDATRHSDAVMQNLIGHDADDWPRIAALPGACIHLYGKREAREGRKMGHVNFLTIRSG
ncbi:MAG: 5-(carboxyamino)imidazole ribonucleotide synthase [Hyphomicrobiaceae bacterium]|nr:5-(carboxyamino)imidazole ribonucleotide synthase [Hyphomicrobiaceae bacterium]